MADTTQNIKFVGYKGYIKGIVALIVAGAIVAGLTVTAFGQAITFAALNVDTVNKVADMRSDYNAKFEIAPKE